MSGFETLLVLTEHFTGEAITLHADRCLNARFQAVGCVRCADSCPAEGAIHVTNGKPALDNEACLGCGLCLHYCPTGAFSRPDAWSGKLVKTAAALPPGPVDLVCPQHPNPESGPAPAAVQTKRCLAALSPATLLELALDGRQVWLDDSFCAECPLGSIHPALAETAAEANAWSRLVENSAPIALRTRQTDSPAAARRPVYNADQPPLSRRGFFGSLKELGQESLGTVIADEWPDPAASGRALPVSKRLPQRLPPQRAKILTLLNKAGSAPAADKGAKSNLQSPISNLQLPLAQVTVDPARCSACGLCARFCPSGALTFASDETRFVLAFRPSLCLGERCDICPLACPEKCVTLEPARPSPELLAREPRYLAAGELAACQQCGAPIAAGTVHPPACFVCRSSGSGLSIFKSPAFSPKPPAQ